MKGIRPVRNKEIAQELLEKTTKTLFSLEKEEKENQYLVKTDLIGIMHSHSSDSYCLELIESYSNGDELYNVVRIWRID